MIDTLVFCHGLGLEACFFDKLKSYLKGYQFIDWDLGYFSTKKMLDIPDNACGIGHSFGFYKLFEHKSAFKGLVSLGGFIDFIGSSRKRLKELEMLYQLCQSSERDFLDTFYKYLKKEPFFPPFINQTRLLEDLSCLKHPLAWDDSLSILALGCEDDHIVSKDLFLRNFANTHPILFKKGGHLFVDTHAQHIAELIVKFIQELK